MRSHSSLATGKAYKAADSLKELRSGFALILIPVAVEVTQIQIMTELSGSCLMYFFLFYTFCLLFFLASLALSDFLFRFRIGYIYIITKTMHCLSSVY
jgi:hypothetical protein